MWTSSKFNAYVLSMQYAMVCNTGYFDIYACKVCLQGSELFMYKANGVYIVDLLSCKLSW